MKRAIFYGLLSCALLSQAAISATIADNERRAQSVITQSYAIIDNIPHFFDTVSRKIPVVGIEQSDKLMNQAATRMHVLKKISRNIDTVTKDAELSYATRCKLKRLNLRLDFCIDDTQSRISSLRNDLVNKEQNDITTKDISYEDPIDSILRNDTTYFYSKELAEMKMLQTQFRKQLQNESVKREELLDQYNSYVRTSTALFGDVQEKIGQLKEQLCAAHEQQALFEKEISKIYESISAQSKRIDLQGRVIAEVEMVATENKKRVGIVKAREAAQKEAIQLGKDIRTRAARAYNVAIDFSKNWHEYSTRALSSSYQFIGDTYSSIKKQIVPDSGSFTGFVTGLKNKLFSFFDWIEESVTQIIIPTVSKWINTAYTSTKQTVSRIYSYLFKR